MSAVAGSCVQDINTRAVRADALMSLDTQVHPGVAKRPVTTVTGDDTVVDVKGFRGKNGAVRHGVLDWVKVGLGEGGCG